MIKLGLLGKDIQHSRSSEMYKKIYVQEIDYRLFDFPNEDAIPTIQKLMEQVQGLSITSPYKKVFLKHVKMQDEICKLNAINCIKKVGNNFHATNTDYLALNELIDQYHFGSSLCILGDGAMGKIVAQLCLKKGIDFKVYSRKLGNISNLGRELQTIGAAHLVINTCAREFIFNQFLPAKSVFWDLNYNMKEHEEFFHNQNITYIDGLSLLELQARHAVTFWNFTFS